MNLPIIPLGYCQCGCGAKTSIAKQNRKDRSWIKGQPLRFCANHMTKSPVDYLVDEKTGCWVWMKGGTARGYGLTRRSGKLIYAHRLYYETFNGVDPGPSDVCHTCDNPPCVNPKHLFLGNASVNALDMVSKGRWHSPPMKGESNGNSKLTEKDIKEIRRLASTGLTQRQIAKPFGVYQSTIKDILRKRIWAHVP